MGAVVVGYLVSPEGEAAVRQGIAEARLRSARLVVVHSEHAHHEDEGSDERLAAMRYVEVLLSEAGVAHEFRHHTGRDPVSDVLNTAEAEGAEIIVIGIRKRSPVGKLVLGSHSQSILLDSHIPVLAVKA